MDIFQQDERQPQATPNHLVCRLLLSVEREWFDQLLSQHRAGQHWLHIFQDTESYQWSAPDLGTCDKHVLCAFGEQVWTENALLGFNCGCADHLHQ